MPKEAAHQSPQFLLTEPLVTGVSLNPYANFATTLHIQFSLSRRILHMEIKFELRCDGRLEIFPLSPPSAPLCSNVTYYLMFANSLLVWVSVTCDGTQLCHVYADGIHS